MVHGTEIDIGTNTDTDTRTDTNTDTDTSTDTNTDIDTSTDTNTDTDISTDTNTDTNTSTDTNTYTDIINTFTHERLIDMQVENTLRSNAHIDQLVNKMSSTIGRLRGLRHIVPPATLLQIYNAIVVPHVDYGDIVYESWTQNNLDRLQKMQNQAARIISGSSHHTHRNDMYADLNWLSLKIRYLMH